MPGLPASERSDMAARKKAIDWEIITIVAYQVFVLHLSLSVRVVENRFFQQKKIRIPYRELGYPDVISYLSSVKGLIVNMNDTNGQYQVMADDQQDFTDLLVMYFDPEEH